MSGFKEQNNLTLENALMTNEGRWSTTYGTRITIQCRIDVGPASTTLAQRPYGTGSVSCLCWDWHRLYLHLHKLIGCREDAESTEKRLSTFFPDATSSNIKFMEHVLLETIDT